MEALKTKLYGSSLGGYLRIRYEDDGKYIDYLSDFVRESGQKIEFGENLLDYSQEVSALDIATAILPLGAKNEETGNRLTIETVNGGKKMCIRDSIPG